MKKKIGIILVAVLLCVVLIFTFAACKKKKTQETQTDGAVVSAEEQTKMQSKIDSYLETWLLTNAQEEGQITDQKKALGKDLADQVAVFSFTDSNNETVKPTFNVSFAGGTYTVVVSWNKGAIKQTFTKAAKTLNYKNWAGKYSKPQDDWLIEGKAIGTVDEIVSAAIKTVNNVTSNATTGKFGANGTIGIEVNGTRYGLQIKGNIDGTQRDGNEIGLAIVNEDGKAIGGLYYKAADSMLYFQYATKDSDGNLKRDSQGNFEYKYKYLDNADIYGLIEGYLPKDKFGKTTGVIAKTVDGEKVALEPDTLAELLSEVGANSATTIVNAVVNTIAKAYENDGRYYIDINLGAAISKVSDMLGSIGEVDISFLKTLDIDPAAMYGLQGHITISAKVNGNSLTDFELAVNIPECTFNMNGKEGADANAIDIPPISFAIYFDDFNFLTSGKVSNVVPAEAANKAVYFSPTNVNLSGEVYINHTEYNAETQKDDVLLDDTFHFEFVTDINPMEVASKKLDSSAKIALVIKQSQGDTYDPDTATNFLSISYEQADKIFCVSGTALDMDDDGTVIYTYSMSKKDDAINALKLWLGMDTESGNWHGLNLDDSTTNNTLLKIVDGTKLWDSAKALLLYQDDDKTLNDFKARLTGRLLNYFKTKRDAAEKAYNDSLPKDGDSTAEAGFSVTKIGDYFNAFKELIEEYINAKKIDVSLGDTDENGNKIAGYAKIDVTLEMINQIIGTINDSFGADIDEITDPQYVKLLVNYDEATKDKCYVTVNAKGNTYELTFDDSVAKTFSITFTYTNTKNRVYTFNFSAKKLTEGETTSATLWDATVKFDIVNSEKKVVNHTEVKLSNFHGTWGKDNAEAIKALIPTEAQKADAQPIFPASNEKNVGTQLVKGLMKMLTADEKVEEVTEKIGQFIIRQIVDGMDFSEQE